MFKLKQSQNKPIESKTKLTTVVTSFKGLQHTANWVYVDGQLCLTFPNLYKARLATRPEFVLEWSEKLLTSPNFVIIFLLQNLHFFI